MILDFFVVFWGFFLIFGFIKYIFFGVIEQINFLFGVRIKVDVFYVYNGVCYYIIEYLFYMNIDVQVFLDDFGLSEGFCGNWNGDSLDDFIGGDNI